MQDTDYRGRCTSRVSEGKRWKKLALSDTLVFIPSTCIDFVPVLGLQTKLSSEAETSENEKRSLIFIAALLLFFYYSFFTPFLSPPPPSCYVGPVGNVALFADRRLWWNEETKGDELQYDGGAIRLEQWDIFLLGPSDGE